MKQEIRLSVDPEMIIEAVKAMRKKDRDEFLEDLLAATSSDFIESIPVQLTPKDKVTKI
ncbi:MAG: hypothetical protein R6U13_00265 [Desulfatiglandaceae bacterium]